MAMESDSKAGLRVRMRRMVYVLFAVYWILVAACLVFPRATGDPGEGLSGGTVVTLVFLCLMMITFVISLALAFFSLRHRDVLAVPDQVMGLLPLAFSLLAVISLWQLA